ncbi:alpha/beta fold hydrolase [Pseudonocardia pini]|uniref:alpha/beta fold hydrolase n=1 Tax=Pseudonocardia pini TaxID=2758030 RepID=UPI0015F04E3C|nr:alpha/beta hydrolase [Pseudonocardia pini]
MTESPTVSPLETAADRFPVRYWTAPDGVRIAYVRRGEGGVPLVLAHGWPGSKRLFWKVVEPLAEAGFDVVAPDARGFGDSDVPGDPAGFADLGLSATDLHGLLTSLGIDSCVAAGGDFGAGVVQDLAARCPGLVRRMVLWNGVAAPLDDEYARAGIAPGQLGEIELISDHLQDNGLAADATCAALGSDAERRAHVRGYLTARAYRAGGPPLRLAAPGAFTEEELDFQLEPFGDAARLRATLGYYEGLFRPELCPVPTVLGTPARDTETLVLYGVEDEIVGPSLPRRHAIAYPNHVGPFLVQDSGHFVPWEAPGVFVSAVRSFARDLLA